MTENSDNINKEQLSKTSPYKKAGYFAVFAAAAGIALPFVFGINTFAWMSSWMVDNWPQLIIIAGLAIWVGKSHLGG